MLAHLPLLNKITNEVVIMSKFIYEALKQYSRSDHYLNKYVRFMQSCQDSGNINHVLPGTIIANDVLGGYTSVKNINNSIYYMLLFIFMSIYIYMLITLLSQCMQISTKSVEGQ